MAYRSSASRQRSRARKRVVGRSLAGLAILAILIALGWTAYEAGSKLAALRVAGFETDNARLTAERDAARADIARLDAALAAERQARAEVQKHYDAEVPTGANAELYALLQSRLRAGLSAPRATQLLREAADTRNCDARGTRRRFPITIGAGKPETTPLLEGMIAVSATQQSAGADPRATTILISPAWLAEPIRLEGMPARHDIVVNNLVLKLTVEASEVAGYANATLSGCGR